MQYGSGTKVSGVSTDGMTYESLQEAWDDVLGAGRENAGTLRPPSEPSTVGPALQSVTRARQERATVQLA